MKYVKMKDWSGGIPLGSIMRMNYGNLAKHEAILTRNSGKTGEWQFTLNELSDGNGWSLPQTEELSALASDNKPLPLQVLTDKKLTVLTVWKPKP